MLSWVVKVVPQPPNLKNGETKEEAPAPPPVPPPEKKVTFREEIASNIDKGKDGPTTEGNGPGTTVLTWISSAIPQPVNNKEESAPPSNNPEDDKGVMAWISYGLEKVVPHPELKNKEPEVVVPAPAPVAPAPVEVRPSPEEKVENKTSMMSWIKQGIEKVVPQPEHLKAKENGKNEAPAAPKVEAPPPPPPPAPLAEDTPSTEQQTNVVGWIVSGFQQMLPQPVHKDGGDTVQNINIGQTKNDLFVEDLEPNHETKTQEPPTQTKEEPTKQSSDTQTQIDQLTALKDSIKKETEEEVLAHMEERLQQERLEAARVAEEMALKAAEEAVRQLEVEQSAKIIIDTLPEPQDQ